MDSPCIKQTVGKVLKIFQHRKYLVAYVLKSSHSCGHFCCLPITFANVGTDLDSTRLTLVPEVVDVDGKIMKYYKHAKSERTILLYFTKGTDVTHARTTTGVAVIDENVLKTQSHSDMALD